MSRPAGRPNRTTVERVEHGRWWFPKGAYNAHFISTTGRSLCGRYKGEDFDKIAADSPDDTYLTPLADIDCVACRTIVDRVVAFLYPAE